MAKGGAKVLFSQVFGIFKVRETGNREYWFAQIVVLLSTVVGVYLAAQAGYKTAIEFEVTRGQRDGYYLRRTLLAELKSNIRAVDDWSGDFEKRLRKKIDPAYFEPADDWVFFFNDKMGWAYLGELTDPQFAYQMERKGHRKLARAYYPEEEQKVRLQNTFVPDELKLKTFIWDTMKEQLATLQLHPDIISSIQSYYVNMSTYMTDVRSNTEKAGPAAAAIHADTKSLRNSVIAFLEKDTARLHALLMSKGIELQ